ncbi:MAG: SusC/RagA family TonB-linked outer membrane protein [Chloroherpetonaceae bacterium]|nr:SusC/RagA family TonB-linked outer membrane protein [Chloroherpetonaceae bacterium]MDW8018954.1 SusC/RagA family TonB-linked outer membrane protein [Chloroherpetonaceae bacterium]
MKKAVILFLSVVFLCTGRLWAQERTVRGTVKAAEDGSPLIGATVLVKDTRVGTKTNVNGQYSIQVPSGATTLVFSYIGYRTIEVAIGDRTVIDVTLEIDAKQVAEIVVTGVAEGTSTKKLGFAIGKIDEETIKQVPAVDPANAIRGKVSGVTIVQPTGIPGTAPTIRLRGSTNIQGQSTPLIIIDGVITPPGTTLADIDINSVESIEIIKGAAGASLYGSQAANGVIQIITKRGADNPGATDFTARTEWGFTNLQKLYPLANHHAWRVENNDFVPRTPGSPLRALEADQYVDNPYPGQVRDHQKELFKNRSFNQNFFSIGSTGKNTNFYASGARLFNQGILELTPAFDRYNVNLNADHKIGGFKLSGAIRYTNSVGPDAIERTQGGPFYGVLLLEPDFDLYTPNPDGTPYWAYPGQVLVPGGRSTISNNNAINPLYSLSTTTFDLFRSRVLANASLSYQIFDWWRVEAQGSYDRANEEYKNVTRRNTYNSNMTGYTNGGLFAYNSMSDGLILTANSYFKKSFEDFNLSLTLRYQFERYTTLFDRVSGSQFVVSDVPQPQALTTSTLSNFGSNTDVRAENIFANAIIDYKEKYILEALVRRDASSLFGPDARSQFFYRISGAWRVTQDFDIPNIQEWKVRASYGTSGQRPPFVAQYETFDIVNGVPVKNLLGNRALRPSRVGEFEVGTNLLFLNRFTFEFNYANSIADDQILIVPLFAYAGFTQQFRNAGKMQSTTFEFSLGAEVLREEDWKFNMNIVASRIRQEIVELGRPPFPTNGNFGVASAGGVANTMFRIEAGQPFGVMYGNRHARSLDELKVDQNGFVTNLVGLPRGVLRREDFTINSDGYVIRRFAPISATNPANSTTPAEGSPFERPWLLADEDGSPLVTKIGDSNPDWLLSISGTLSWKKLSLYFLLDTQIGGDIYNATRQLLYFAGNGDYGRHGDLDQAGKPQEKKKAFPYYTATTQLGYGTGLYNGNNPTQHFVESGSFLIVREINVAYTFDADLLNSIGLNFIRDIRLALIGRNLFTFSSYSGYNPEVALAGNATSFRVDQFTYPVFRTFTASLQVRF